MALDQKLHLTSSRPDLGHVGTTSCKGAWETTCFCFPASIIEESKEEVSMFRQSTGSMYRQIDQNIEHSASANRDLVNVCPSSFCARKYSRQSMRSHVYPQLLESL